MKQETKENTGKGSAGPPVTHELPLPKDLSRCEGCPYPGIGFICWNTKDGTCMRTDEEELSRRDERRRRK